MRDLGAWQVGVAVEGLYFAVFVDGLYFALPFVFWALWY
jgi:hypothetical protein